MKKVISFCLWGSNPTYTEGLVKNIKLAQEYYPEFESWVYIHRDSVPEEIITTLHTDLKVKLIFREGPLDELHLKPRLWRFEPIDDPEVEVMISRDTDTRILQREANAVRAWLQSSYTFHIMRDHPHHTFPILAGMFGTKKINGFNWSSLISKYKARHPINYDQDFLAELVYPLVKESSLIHTSFFSLPHEKIETFPDDYSSDFQFVGEYVYKDGTRSTYHQLELLKCIDSPIEFLDAKNKIISIVIGTYQRIKFLPLTIASIRAELKDISHEIIVIDGGSTDGTIEWLAAQKDIVTIIQHNRGLWNGENIIRRTWGYFMNLGFKTAQGKYVCMLSDDCIVIPRSIINGLELFERTRNAGINLGGIAFYWRNWPNQVEYVVGQTWGDKIFVNHGLYLNEALKSVNYVDEEAFSFYHADGDLSLKIWDKGYLFIDSPNSYIEHYVDPEEEVRTSNLSTQPKDWETYTNKWKPILGNATQDWIVRHFVDKTHSAKMFEKAIKKTPASSKSLIKRIYHSLTNSIQEKIDPTPPSKF